jgi:hydrogenase maturation protease
MTARTLVAGVGNVFLGDDGFGVEVARLLAERPHQDGVEIADFGIRGVHLVYELLDGCDLFVLVDAAPRGLEPGTVTVLEVEPDTVDPNTGAPGAPVMDGHGLSPDDLFAMLATMGGRPGRSLLVACEPADVNAGMGLSEPVRAALPHAVRAVEEILSQIGQKEGVRDAAQADHPVGDSDAGFRGGGRPAGPQALPRD